MDTYAPALPKEASIRNGAFYRVYAYYFYILLQAILGAHSYKAHEHYSPVWTLVQVPERFLSLVCPMAEDIVASIEGMRRNFYPLPGYLLFHKARQI